MDRRKPTEREAMLEEEIRRLDSLVKKMENDISKSLPEIKATLQELNENTKSMKEIIDAWNNAKGFVKTIKLISSVAKAIAVIGGFFGAIWIFVQYGKWPQ